MTKLPKVLIVDASRVVRASVGKCLRGNFDVCEEADAESAWQSLVLDSSIVAVVSGLDVKTLEGAGLIERLRASKLPRLNQLLFLLLVSDSFSEEGRALAMQLGVSEFIPKKSAGLAIKHRLLNHQSVSDQATAGEAGSTECGTQSDVGLGDFMSRVDRLAGLNEAPENLSSYPAAGDEERLDHCLHASLAQADGRKVSAALVFGLDDYEDFRLRYGSELVDTIVLKLSRLLASKIRSDESLLHLLGGRIAIVSATAGREQCASFAKRVCKALAAAKISLRGEPVPATISVGVAAQPEDQAATTTDELLRLASSRLDAAVLAGGNRVVYVTGCGGNSVNQEEFFERLRELLAGAEPGTMMSCKGWVTAVCGTCRSLRAAGKASLCATAGAAEECTLQHEKAN